MKNWVERHLDTLCLATFLAVILGILVANIFFVVRIDSGGALTIEQDVGRIIARFLAQLPFGGLGLLMVIRGLSSVADPSNTFQTSSYDQKVVEIEGKMQIHTTPGGTQPVQLSRGRAMIFTLIGLLFVGMGLAIPLTSI